MRELNDREKAAINALVKHSTKSDRNRFYKDSFDPQGQPALFSGEYESVDLSDYPDDFLSEDVKDAAVKFYAESINAEIQRLINEGEKIEPMCNGPEFVMGLIGLIFFLIGIFLIRESHVFRKGNITEANSTLVNNTTSMITSTPSNVTSNISSVMSNVSNVTSNLSSVMSNLSSVMSNVSNVMSNVSNVMSNVSNVTSNISSVNQTVTERDDPYLSRSLCASIFGMLMLTVVTISCHSRSEREEEPSIDSCIEKINHLMGLASYFNSENASDRLMTNSEYQLFLLKEGLKNLIIKDDSVDAVINDETKKYNLFFEFIKKDIIGDRRLELEIVEIDVRHQV